MKMTSKEDIQKQKGIENPDGFYVLEEGGAFTTQMGITSIRKVLSQWGSYDKDGVYIPGNIEAGFKRSKSLKAVSKEEMEKLHTDGEYDDDDFYILENGDFFDFHLFQDWLILYLCFVLRETMVPINLKLLRCQITAAFSKQQR